jgi:type IV pilus assembly protein PilO
MTYTDELGIPVDVEEESPSYPTAFGITFTPKVAGIIFGVLGLLGATYLLLNVVQPSWERYQQLQESVQDKKNQVQQQAQIQKQIKEKQAQLDQAKQRNKQVLSLFASERTLNTLLLNLNSFVKARNGTMVRFEPVADAQAAASGGGDPTAAQPNEKLKRKVYNVEIDGSFDQVQSILRSFERLQSLLIVRDFKAQVSDEQGLLINPESGRSTPAIFKRENNKVIPGGKPDIRTTFKLEALSPVQENDTQAQAQGAAAKPKPAPKPQP